MFELFFGLVWTAFVGLIFGMVSTSQIDTPILIFLGVFGLIGLAFIAVGVRKLVKNLKTNRYGYETYGVVLQIFPTGKSVNSRPILCAEISLVKEDGTTEIFKEDIGFNEKRYHTGTFLKVKYFENDVNILEKLQEANVPFNYVDMLKRDLNEQYNSNFDMYGTYTDEFADIESTEF